MIVLHFFGATVPTFVHKIPCSQYRHGGDLKGIKDRLDYLVDLGINTLWITPILKRKRTAHLLRREHSWYMLPSYPGMAGSRL